MNTSCMHLLQHDGNTQLKFCWYGISPTETFFPVRLAACVWLCMRVCQWCVSVVCVHACVRVCGCAYIQYECSQGPSKVALFVYVLQVIRELERRASYTSTQTAHSTTSSFLQLALTSERNAL